MDRNKIVSSVLLYIISSSLSSVHMLINDPDKKYHNSVYHNWMILGYVIPSGPLLSCPVPLVCVPWIHVATTREGIHITSGVGNIVVINIRV